MMSNLGSDSLTYVIPTHSRPEFLVRLLCFFSETGLSWPIIVADSSGSDQAARSSSACSEIKSSLNVTYAHFDMPFMEKCCDVLSRVKTKYVVFCADDDFQLPAVVDGCAAFLDRNSDFSVAQGRVVHASNNRSQNSRVYECSLMDAFDIEQECAAERLSSMASRPYSTFYGVQRTASLTEQFETTRIHTDYQAGRVFTESLLIGLSAIFGKIKILPDVQYIQQTHGTNDSVVLSRIEDRNRKDELYQQYRTALINKVMAKTSFSEERAAVIVDGSINLVPGHSKKKRSVLGLHHRIAREVTRIWVRYSRLRERMAGAPAASSEKVVIKNDALIPDEGHYSIARRMLVEYPIGFTL